MTGQVAITSRSATHTRRIAAALAARLAPGDLVALVGPLGAGKTCFTSGLVAALPGGEGVRVSSPTFTTVNTYPTTPEVFHVDLYRLSGAPDLDLIGYEEYYEGDGICLVEWFDRVPQAAPADYLELRFELRAGSRRRLIFTARGPRAVELIAGFHP